MKQVLLCSVVFCLLISCHKQYDKPPGPGNDPDPAPGTPLRIKSINSNTFKYDSLGRLIQTFYGNSITARTDYSYAKDSMVGRDYDLQGNPHGGSQVYYFRTDGFATKQKYIIDSTITPLIFSFTYNADRQLAEQLIGPEGAAPTSRDVYYYSKGNMDSSKEYSLPDNRLLVTIRYEYYPDKPNFLSTEHNGIGFVGVGSANLKKKEIHTDTGIGTVTTKEYTYEFDADQRPVKLHAFVDGEPWFDLAYSWF